MKDNKIHKNLLVSFDDFSSDLTNNTVAKLIKREGNEYQNVIKTARYNTLNYALDELTSLGQEEQKLCENNIIDIYFIFNLIEPNRNEKNIESLNELLKICRKAYSIILDKSMTQGYYFSTYGIILLPSIANLTDNQKSDLWNSLASLNKNTKDLPENTNKLITLEQFIHYSFLFSQENANNSLTLDQQKKLVETFLLLLISSPIKNRIKHYLDTLRTSFGRSKLAFFSAGIALLDTSYTIHRNQNYYRSKEIFLTNIYGSSVNLNRVKEVSKEFIFDCFLNPVTYQSEINKISVDLQLNKSEVFGGSVFRLIYSHLENIDELEEIYKRYDFKLKKAIFDALIKNNMDFGFARLMLKEIQSGIEDIYKEVNIDIKDNRNIELEIQYNLYRRKRFLNKLKIYLLTRFKFLQKIYHPEKIKVEPTDILLDRSLTFLRSKIIQDFFNYVAQSINDQIVNIENEISKIKTDRIELVLEKEKNDSPFRIKIFKDIDENDEQSKTIHLLYEKGKDYFEYKIKDFINKASFSLNMPVSAHEAINWLYEEFKTYYLKTLEKEIYKVERKYIIDYYSKGLSDIGNIKTELLKLSSPYISIYHKWRRHTSLFYSNNPDETNNPSDDYHKFLRESFVAEVFNEKTPWEISIVQLEGPFQISDTLYYQVLKK